MNWVSAHHYTMIVHEERLARARTSGEGLNLRVLREAWAALREFAAGLRERGGAGAARASAANVRPSVAH